MADHRKQSVSSDSAFSSLWLSPTARNCPSPTWVCALPFSIDQRYHLDDIASARQPGSRLHDILLRLEGGKTLSPLQEAHLTSHSLLALLDHAKGRTTAKDFALAARQEQAERRMAQAGHDAERQSVATQKAEWLTHSQQQNARIFAEIERKRARRRPFDALGLGYIDHEASPRVATIVHGVTAGRPISAADLLWLAHHGKDYASAELLKAHHRIMALDCARKWQEVGDPWAAVSACAHWRKAGVPDEGRKIAGQALGRTSERRSRSALCTTRGGALRDLGRPEEARIMGLEAHGLSKADYRPCTLLGACHIDLSDYAQANEWYAKAEARGANRKVIDAEIQAILAAASSDKRTEILNALRTLAPERFAKLS